MTIRFGLCKSFCAAESLVLLEYLISLEACMIQHSRNCQGPGLLRNQSYFCHGPRNNVKPSIRKINQEVKLNQDEKKNAVCTRYEDSQGSGENVYHRESEPRRGSVLFLSRGQVTIAVPRNPLYLNAPFKSRNFRAVLTEIRDDLTCMTPSDEGGR